MVELHIDQIGQLPSKMKSLITIETLVKTGEHFTDFFQYEGGFNSQRSVEGALTLSINSTLLIDESMFDYVDDLWSYLSDGLQHVSEGKPFSCFFPDQPIEVKLTPSNGRLQVSVNCHREVSATVDKDEFVRIMSEHARQFFTHLQKIEPRAKGTCSYALGYLDKIHR